MEKFVTLFPVNPTDNFFNSSYLPKDFESYEEAYQFGIEKYGEGNFTIEEPN